jgi:hypothetical protein
MMTSIRANICTYGFVSWARNFIFTSYALGIMTLIPCAAYAITDSQPLLKDKIAPRHKVAKAHPMTSDTINLLDLYATMIRRASDQGADELALSLARQSTELVPDAVLLRIILAKLYINAKQCARAIPHLKHAHDLTDPQAQDSITRRQRFIIGRMRKVCAPFVENAAFISTKGQRSASLLDRPGDDIVAIDKGSLLDRYCHALGSLCAHDGKVALKQTDRGGTSIWLHVGTISKIRTHGMWTPSIRTNIFRKLNSKPYFGLQGAQIQLDMERSVGDKRQFEAHFSAQSISAQQGPDSATLAHEALRAGVTLRHFISEKTSIKAGISQTRILQNMRHSKRFETGMAFITKITKDLKAEASATWARTPRTGGALSSLGRDLKFGISADLSAWAFAGASLRQTKRVFTEPLVYLRLPHQISRRELSANIGLHLSKDKTSLVDLHFIRTSSVSHYSPDNFTDDAVIIYFRHVF